MKIKNEKKIQQQDEDQKRTATSQNLTGGSLKQSTIAGRF